MTKPNIPAAEFELSVTRLIDAPREKVYRCWTEPELMKQWFAPKPWSVSKVERELRPELFEQACEQAGQPLILRRHAGYDHSYYFIQSFIDDHLRYHAKALGLPG